MGEAVVSAVRLEVVPVTVLEVVELLTNDVGKQLPHNAVLHRFLTRAAREEVHVIRVPTSEAEPRQKDFHFPNVDLIILRQR